MSIYDDLIPKEGGSVITQKKENPLKAVARFFLPKQFEKKFGVEKPVSAEETKPALTGTIYDDLLPSRGKTPEVPEVPISPLISGKVPAGETFISAAPEFTGFQKLKQALRHPFEIGRAH